jgi:hypothetical protein
VSHDDSDDNNRNNNEQPQTNEQQKQTTKEQMGLSRSALAADLDGTNSSDPEEEE